MRIQTFIRIFLGLFFLGFAPETIFGQQVSSDNWSATDALGRKVREHNAVGDRKKDKYVAMFYWTWHTDGQTGAKEVRNISEIIRKYPEAAFDYNHPAWGRPQGTCFWEEPLFGYYKTTDPWVLRKHAEMLADAGVDVVFFDCTNGSYTWKSSYDVLMSTWAQAQKDGVNVPKIAFMLPFGPSVDAQTSLRQLYSDIYKSKRNESLWFYWKGKPCIMAYPESLSDSKTDREIADFFTFRPGQPDYVDGPKRKDQWGWMEVYPQNGYAPTADGGYEQAVVGVAQNATSANGGHCYAFNAPDAYSRSFSMKKGFDPRVEGYLYGWNFQEQWDRAFEIDPELIFVTGWNEFIAGQHENWPPNNPHKPFAFPDQYNWDCSRDIEPNKGWGDRGDVYYLQLVDNVRKFKGMYAPQKISAQKNIVIGKADSWGNVEPYYKHYQGNVIHRDHPGHSQMYYRNDSGRNDIVGAKVARDENYIYFYAETASKLTPNSGKNWMMLFIDADRDKSTGWNGYDYVVNRVSPGSDKVVVERNVKGKWMWESVSQAEFATNVNKLEMAISRKALNLSDKDIDIEFKWSDNMQDEGNIMDFYVNGDVAPGGRFNFVYSTK